MCVVTRPLTSFFTFFSFPFVRGPSFFLALLFLLPLSPPERELAEGELSLKSFDEVHANVYEAFFLVVTLCWTHDEQQCRSSTRARLRSLNATAAAAAVDNTDGATTADEFLEYDRPSARQGQF